MRTIKQTILLTSNQSIKFLGALSLIVLMVFSGCEKDPEEVNQEELITTVELLFVPTDTSQSTKTFIYRDIDGVGGNAPVIELDTLDAQTTYQLSVSFKDESVTPAEEITVEVLEEGIHHQVFFTISQNVNVTINYNDQDANALPIGLSNSCQTGNASTGNLTVTLIHEPDKTASGVSSGSKDNAGGETDVEVTFPLVIN